MYLLDLLTGRQSLQPDPCDFAHPPSLHPHERSLDYYVERSFHLILASVMELVRLQMRLLSGYQGSQVPQLVPRSGIGSVFFFSLISVLFFQYRT